MFVLALAVFGCRAPGPEVRSAVEIGILEQSETIEGCDGGASAVVWRRLVLFGLDEPAWGTVSTIADDRLYTFACDGADGPGHRRGHGRAKA